MFTVNDAADKLKELSAQGHGDLVLQITTPCGLQTNVTDFVVAPADFGLLIEVKSE